MCMDIYCSDITQEQFVTVLVLVMISPSTCMLLFKESSTCFIWYCLYYHFVLVKQIRLNTTCLNSTQLNSKCTAEKYLCGCAKFYMVFLLMWTGTGSKLVWWSLGTWQDDHDACNSVLFVSAMICLLLMYVVVLLLECSCRVYLLCKRIVILCKELR